MKKKIIILITLIAIVFAGLSAFPFVKYFMWRNSTIDEINKSVAVFNENTDKIDKIMNVTSSNKDLNKEELEVAKQAMEENMKALDSVKNNVKKADGFWGLDFTNKKDLTNERMDKIGMVIDDLKTKTKYMQEVMSLAEGLQKFGSDETDYNSEEGIKKGIKHIRESAKFIAEKTKDTGVKEDAKEFIDFLNGFANELEKLIEYAKAGNKTKMDEYSKKIKDRVNNLGKTVEKLTKKLDDADKAYTDKIDELNKLTSEI